MMRNYDINKQKQINDIVSVVKLCSLLFAGLAFFQYYSRAGQFSYSFAYLFSVDTVTIFTLILAVSYLLWTFSTNDKFRQAKKVKLLRVIEDFVFLLIFMSAILISGADNSDFKFIFIFIILTATIQSGLKHGVIVAFLSAVGIFLIDLAYSTSSTINTNFENDIILAGVFLLIAWPLGYYGQLEKNHVARLEDMVNRDGLTNIFNHRYFHERLKNLVEESGVRGSSIAVLMIDIDNFKYYNDLFGHHKGDEVLKGISQILLTILGPEDIAARYGGEEFALILPERDEEETIAIAEKIRTVIEETHFSGEQYQPGGKLTVSIGYSTYPDKAGNELELINSADDAMYRAKFFNKNRVERYVSILEDLRKDINEEHLELLTSIKTLISVINAKDRYTYSHVERVVLYCRLIAERLGLSEEDKDKLILGAYMHDVGKINIPEEILVKKTSLTEDEWKIIRQHPSNGVEIIRSVESLSDIAPLILHHHERVDGTGYPQQLAGESIPYLARVLCIVDSFDAMTSKRSYIEKRMSYDDAAAELKANSGTQFDKAIVEKFIEVIEENKGSFDEYLNKGTSDGRAFNCRADSAS